MSKLPCPDIKSDGGRIPCTHFQTRMSGYRWRRARLRPWVPRAVNPDFQIGIDNDSMLLPQLEFCAPVNFVCKKCVDISEIYGKVSIRKSPIGTNLNDLAVSDVIAFEKSLGN